MTTPFKKLTYCAWIIYLVDPYGFTICVLRANSIC
jgi:hypothetical protein